MINFFVDIKDQNFFLFQNLTVYIHSHSSPHSIWTSLWLDWKKNFVSLHTETFIGAKIDNDMNASLVDNQNKNSFYFRS